MATALARGAVEAGMLSTSQLVFAEPSEDRAKFLRKNFSGCSLVADGTSVLAKAEKVILAVKPHILKAIAAELAEKIGKEHLLISIAAAISLSDLQGMLGTQRVIRVMPNTPSQVGAGAAAIAADSEALESDVAWVESLMNSVGSSVRVPDHLIHAVTGVSGSSPAYIYLIIEALSDGGVAMGLPRDVATKLAAQAVVGAGKMVLDTGMHPGQLKDQVTSPGGTTIAAIRTLESAGVRSAFIEAVARCTERSREMS